MEKHIKFKKDDYESERFLEEVDIQHLNCCEKVISRNTSLAVNNEGRGDSISVVRGTASFVEYIAGTEIYKRTTQKRLHDGAVSNPSHCIVIFRNGKPQRDEKTVLHEV